MRLSKPDSRKGDQLIERSKEAKHVSRASKLLSCPTRCFVRCRGWRESIEFRVQASACEFTIVGGERKLKLDVMKERLPRRASLINSGARRTVDRCGRRL
jgi:hypothetical protein